MIESLNTSVDEDKIALCFEELEKREEFGWSGISGCVGNACFIALTLCLGWIGIGCFGIHTA
jgi:hypothetical protein